MDVTTDPAAALLASLVELAVASDDPGALIAAAGAQLQRPLGLVDQSGAMLGRAPNDRVGERAVSIARAAARNALVAPPGWSLVRLNGEGRRFGVLAIGEAAANGAPLGAVLRLLPTLLTDQLRRGALLGLQRAAFVRRLVSTPAPAPHLARREAAELGIDLAAAYWPAVLTWRGGTIHPDVIETIGRDALSRADRALCAQVDERLVLLHPADQPDAGHQRAARWFAYTATLARRAAPASSARTIAAELPAGLDGLGARTRHLAHLARYVARTDSRRPVAWEHEYALDDLLAGQVDADVARRFVELHVGRLIAFDRERGTNLLGILEAGLDFPRHDQAAHRCFMHRNTFRHRLGQATELLDHGLDEPEQRLAVHVAIKLHRTTQASAHDAGAPRAGPLSTRGAST